MHNKEVSTGRINQRDKLKDTLEIREFEWTPKQKELIDTILNKDTKIVFVSGPAGTAKTLIAVYCGLRLLNEKKVSDIVYVRSLVESSSKSTGYLPGTIQEKFKPFLMPLEDKMEELLCKTDTNKLINDSRVNGLLINHLRGANFVAKYIISDEVQQMTTKEGITLLTRLGKHSKLILCGDFLQSEINGHSGFLPLFNLFNDEEARQNGIYCFSFQIQDCMRSGTVKFILERIEKQKIKSI